MLTFNVVLGYQGLLFRDFLWGFFFQSGPTGPISGNAFHGKQRKKGDGLSSSHVFNCDDLLLIYRKDTVVNIVTIPWKRNWLFLYKVVSIQTQAVKLCKNSFNSDIVCAWTRKIFWVNILRSFKPSTWNYLHLVRTPTRMLRKLCIFILSITR